MRLKNLIEILICMLFISLPEVKADCIGWSVDVNLRDTAICSAQSIELNMIVHNDTAILDPTSEFHWYVKKPSASDYELLTETTISTAYSFDEVGVYSVKAAARPNECTIYHESSPISIELYPALTVGTIGNSQTICYNSIPEALSQLTSPIGGNGEIALQWQASTDNGSSWSNIAGEHGTSLTLPQLTQTTKYRIQYSSCETIDYSNEITITIRTPASAPTITSSLTPLCYNQGTATLSVIQEAVGASDETYDYQWQDSSDGTEFSDISGATGTNFTTPTQTSARWYRVVATSSRGCGSVASPSVKVDVYPDWSISNTSINPLCYMTGGEISVSATGAENNYLYQWQESNDGSAWSNISSANSSHYSIPSKIGGTYYYRALVAPTTGCASKFSDVFTVIVYEDLTAGTIVGADTICYNNAPALLSQSVAPTGGNGQFTYRWQQRTSGAWSDILGATETTYQPEALTTTTYYRLIATTSCGSIESNEIEVYVMKDITSPTITATPETVCYGFAPALIFIPTQATCDVHDSMTYQWQQRTTGAWENIDGATELTYQPEPITTAHQYRVIATSVKGCGQRESNVRTVNVYDDLQISTTVVAPLCYMASGTISVSATGEGGSYTYQWQETADGIVFTDIEGATSASYQTAPKPAGNYTYRCVVSPTLGCEPDTSANIVVTVYDDLSAGTIVGTDTICYNNAPALLFQSVEPTGGNGQFTYQWQKKTTGNWENISNATNTTYQPETLTTTTYYRLVATTTCGNIESNEIEVYVRKDITSPAITATPETVCYGFAPALISIPTLATCDANDSMTYQWQQRTTGAWENIDGATELTYQPEPITTAHQYRVIATSVKGCGQRESNERTVNVYDDLQISTTGVAPLCYMASGTISVSATGEGGSYTYQWQETADGIVFIDIDGATSASYQTAPKPAGNYTYRCVVSPTLGCEPDTSVNIVVTVYDDLSAGTIVGADTICYNNAPALLSQSVAPTGGNGQFTYRWQQRTSGAWSDILGATETTYQPEALTTTTYYRLIATTSCGNIESNEIEVYVRKDLTSPTITATPETVCYGFAPALISIPTQATCDVHDSMTYQWQQRTTGAWENIDGATGLTYQPEPITTAHQYRVIATSVKGCGQRESNARTVNVYDDLQISTTGVAPLCYMTRGSIRVSATGEGDSYAFQWQDSVAGVWSDLSSGNAAIYTTQPKEGGTYYYRCIVLPTLGCTPDTSSVIEVVVYDSVDPGTITPTGADTICYGFIPDALSVNTHATGGDGNYTYQWLRRQEGATNFSYISGATDTTYSPTALYKTTEYQLEVTSSCDVKFTNIIRIYVRNELQAPILDEHTDTICYNTIPDPIIVTELPTGGVDDSFTYQWEVSDNGSTYTAIVGETATTYRPEALLKTKYYRLRATSAKSCGDVISNAVKVNVYDSLHIITQNPDTLCYKTSTAISVIATGGGESFGFQWQELIDGVWTDIAGATASSYPTEPRIKGDYLYRCIVSSNKCDDYARISPEIKVSVYDGLTPGTIIGADSTCYGFAPAELLHVDVPASGVDGHYTYQWQILDNNKWKDIKGETKTSYQPEALTKGTEYRLRVASKCDTLTTNSIFIRVNPLPEVQVINGRDNVCYNQHEIYSIENLNPGFTYEWMIENGNGELTTEALNVTSTDVLWKNPNTRDSIILRITNNITGCEREIKFGVVVCNEQAPERTIIVRKPNSNILVCEEDGELIYQWGYTEKSSSQEFPIEDSNRRYVLLPHTFDDVAYDYWLELRYEGNVKCYSRSYYDSENQDMIQEPESKLQIPTYVRGRIPIIVQNPQDKEVSCIIYSMSGQVMSSHELGQSPYIETELPFSVNAGMYLMRVKIGEDVESVKLIAE